MEKIKGLVLCGGPGTRLRPITYYFQKSMVPIGSKQKPLLEYIVRLLKFHGISDLTFLVNYKAEQIINYFDDGSRFGVKISYLQDDARLKGTAGALLNAYNKGAVNSKDDVLVYYGDILTNLNLKELVEYHRKKKASATVALASGFTVRVGLADMEENGRIHGFIEKPTLEKPVSIGVLVFDGKSLEIVKKLGKTRNELDLMRDVIPHLIEIGENVYGYVSKVFWYDVGSTESYEKLKPKVVDRSLSFLFRDDSGPA